MEHCYIMDNNSGVKINEKARCIAKELLKLGFTLQVYCAYSTNSVYIKLDYGACNSIRISDHTGKEYLNYRYNLTKGLIDGRVEKKRYIRYYYPFTKCDDMIKQILTDREYRIKQYSLAGYRVTMDNNIKDGRGKAGFWDKAAIVKTANDIDDIIKDK